MRNRTLSNILYGEQQRKEGDHRRRSEAAKKAWKTRRANMKLSKVQLEIVEFMVQEEGHLIATWGVWHTWFSIKSKRIHNPKVTYQTFISLKKKKMIDCVKRDRVKSGASGKVVNGKIVWEDHYEVVERWDLTGKAKEALAKAKGE